LWILPFIDIYVQIKKFGRKIVMLVSYCNVQDVSITGAIFPLLQFFSFDSNIDKKVFDKRERRDKELYSKLL
jgi:hypothetical protein